MQKWSNIKAKGRVPEHLARLDAEVNAEAKRLADGIAKEDPCDTPMRRPYSGPSRAVRLMHYRAAALASLIPDELDRADAADLAKRAETIAQAMLAAEKAPPRKVATTEGGGQ